MNPHTNIMFLKEVAIAWNSEFQEEIDHKAKLAEECSELAALLTKDIGRDLNRIACRHNSSPVAPEQIIEELADVINTIENLLWAMKIDQRELLIMRVAKAIKGLKAAGIAKNLQTYPVEQ